MQEIEPTQMTNYVDKAIDIIFGLPGLILLLLFIFGGLLRNFLKKVSDNTKGGLESIDVSPTELKIKLAQTAIGETKVEVNTQTLVDKSEVNKSKPQEIIDNKMIHTSSKYGYTISWTIDHFTPMAAIERENQERFFKNMGAIAPNQDIDLIILDSSDKTLANEGFKPNVNITVYPTSENGINIQKFVHELEQGLFAANIKVGKTEINRSTDSAVIEYNNVQEFDTVKGKIKKNLAHVHKFAIYRDLVYQVTATFENADDSVANSMYKTDKIKSELNDILNSFELIAE